MWSDSRIAGFTIMKHVKRTSPDRIPVNGTGIVSSKTEFSNAGAASDCFDQAF